MGEQQVAADAHMHGVTVNPLETSPFLQENEERGRAAVAGGSEEFDAAHPPVGGSRFPQTERMVEVAEGGGESGHQELVQQPGLREQGEAIEQARIPSTWTSPSPANRLKTPRGRARAGARPVAAQGAAGGRQEL